MQTRNGIELNLNESKYNFKFLGLVFYFSSMFYMEKFKKEVKNYINVEQIRLKNRYNMNLLINRCLAISLYKKIEKRGFRVFDSNLKKEIEENEIFIESIKV